MPDWLPKAVFIQYNSERLRGEKTETGVRESKTQVFGVVVSCYFENGLENQRARELIKQDLLRENPQLNDDELTIGKIDAGWWRTRTRSDSEALYVSERGCRNGSPI